MLMPVLVSVALAVLAALAFRLSWRRLRGRRRVRATVVSLSVGAAKAGDGFGISPIFEYCNDRGHAVRVSCVCHGKHALMPKLGDAVDIYIDPRRPQYATLDRPESVWLAPVMLALLSLMFLYMGMAGK
jgi:hypothetical protein